MVARRQRIEDALSLAIRTSVLPYRPLACLAVRGLGDLSFTLPDCFGTTSGRRQAKHGFSVIGRSVGDVVRSQPLPPNFPPLHCDRSVERAWICLWLHSLAELPIRPNPQATVRSWLDVRFNPHPERSIL